MRLRGLPFRVTEEDIYRFFAGLNVIGLFICHDHSGRSTGEGFVEFQSMDDCQLGMSRNRVK